MDTQRAPERPPAPYRALDILLRQCAPKVAGRPPYWRPTPADPAGAAWVPAWHWRTEHAPPAGELVAVLDTNAAYLSAISTVEVAHGAIVHTGTMPFDPARPGYWLLQRHDWPQWDTLFSPLGGSPGYRTGDHVWLTTPTVQLLQQLADDGYWPAVEVLDSWTCATRCRLRGWAQRIRDDRAAAIAAGNRERVEAIKLGYSQAVTLLAVDETSRAFRPDWSAHIRAQHAATSWRKAWRTLCAGFGPLAAGAVDELVYPREVVREWWNRRADTPPPPLQIDTEGVQLGTFKVKAVCQWITYATGANVAERRRRPAAVRHA